MGGCIIVVDNGNLWRPYWIGHIAIEGKEPLISSGPGPAMVLAYASPNIGILLAIKA